MAIFVAGFAVITVGCSVVEDTTTTVASLTETATDMGQAESINYEIESSTDFYVGNSQTGGFKVKSAVIEASGDSVITTVTHPPLGILYFPKTITIDFGTVGVLGKRGNTLKGKIVVEISAKMTDANSKRVIKFVNFSVNGNSVKGIKTVVFDGLSSWTVTARDTIATTNGVIVSNSDRVRKFAEGLSTPLDFSDDKYEISGSSTGVNKKGASYSMKITAAKPLVLLAGWPFFVSGEVTTSTEKKTVILDYGNGAKDATATLTYNGISKEVTLKK